MKPTTKDIIQTSIVGAFTIAVALIWKDVIIEAIESVVPPSEELFYKLITAIAATVFAVLAIYFTLKTETEAEIVIKKAELIIEKFTKKKKPDNPEKTENAGPTK